MNAIENNIIIIDRTIYSLNIIILFAGSLLNANMLIANADMIVTIVTKSVNPWDHNLLCFKLYLWKSIFLSSTFTRHHFSIIIVG